MKYSSFLQSIISFLALINLATALRLEIPASAHNPPPKCLREFVQDRQMVVVTINTDGHQGDGQILSMTITDSLGNEYRNKRDIVGNFKVAFTAQSTSAFDICFTNELQGGYRGGNYVRDIELDIEAGAAARDWNAIQSAERLKPSEVQLRKVDEMIDEISSELDYLFTT
ncbi:unnamed protein product [Ambrosiozyma monospora]|uniref:Unnamed protein product n=1 Tax=Ambrosiozyma monospora TaxID=43982 RepID=A0ACB5ST29_AMBMO|nr:unnamed protein product [Ambrosiozyma monospora]